MNNFEKCEKIGKILYYILCALSIVFIIWFACSLVNVWTTQYHEANYAWWNFFEIVFGR